MGVLGLLWPGNWHKHFHGKADNIGEKELNDLFDREQVEVYLEDKGKKDLATERQYINRLGLEYDKKSKALLAGNIMRTLIAPFKQKIKSFWISSGKIKHYPKQLARQALKVGAGLFANEAVSAIEASMQQAKAQLEELNRQIERMKVEERARVVRAKATITTINRQLLVIEEYKHLLKIDRKNQEEVVAEAQAEINDILGIKEKLEEKNEEAQATILQMRQHEEAA